MNDVRDQPGGPWYTLAEVRAQRALMDEHGNVIDANWRKHPKQDLWKPLELMGGGKPKFGTMA